MCAIMVYELVANNRAQGSPISTKPFFNFMIGPSSMVLVNIGARFAPCMRLVPEIPPSFSMGCPSNTANPPTEICSIEQICGHGGFPSGKPDQSWRLFTPIFLHVGIIHLLLNMFAQVTMNGPMERMMGTIPWLIVYIAGGVYGNVSGTALWLTPATRWQLLAVRHPLGWCLWCHLRHRE
jgi:membrane associated rhomboid family serine protease